MNAHDEINLLLRAGAGLLVRRDHPHLAGSLDWLVRGGRLAAVLPGIYAIPEITGSWQTRAKALAFPAVTLYWWVQLLRESPAGQKPRSMTSRPRSLIW